MVRDLYYYVCVRDQLTIKKMENLFMAKSYLFFLRRRQISDWWLLSQSTGLNSYLRGMGASGLSSIPFMDFIQFYLFCQVTPLHSNIGMYMFIGADPRENGEEMIPRDNRITIIASCTSFLFANFAFHSNYCLSLSLSEENGRKRLQCYSSILSQGFKHEDLGNSPDLLSASLATFCPGRPS